MENIVQLDGVANLRDVGETVNQFIGRKLVREGVIFRSARLDDASRKDRAFIREDIGIKSILDLRTKTEIARQAARYEAEVTALRLKSPEAVIEPLKIEGISYHEIQITGRRLERFLVSLLSWWSFIKLLFFHLLGYRLEAIRIVTQEAMNPRGLLMLANDTIDYSGQDIKKALELYARPEVMPSLVHCTHGKDRTGLVCMLVLLILGVPREAIEYDYHLTDISVNRHIKERLREVREVGLADEWIYTAQGQIAVAETHINEHYGGLKPYLQHIGVSETTQDEIRQALLY